MNEDKKIKNERIAIYFDCICGTTSSLIAIIGIFFFALPLGITNPTFFIASLTFWIFYLLMSLYLIALGISIHYANKNYETRAKSRKLRKLKAPMIS